MSNKAIIPSYSVIGDAGLDLTAIDVKYDTTKDLLVYSTGLSIEIPEGYVGLIFPRSSVSNYPLQLANNVGVIDSTYRGEIILKYRNNWEYWSESNDEDFLWDLSENGHFYFHERPEDEQRGFTLYRNVYKIGDRIGQLIIIPYPNIEFEEVDELSETERGEGGYGSTGM